MRYEVILDAGETANKCTIAPLAPRPDFQIFHVRGGGTLGPLTAPILLHHEGQCLTQVRQEAWANDGIRAVASIDCVWRRLDCLIQRIEGKLPLLARLPHGFKTAYPRQSALDTDPPTGLATIEALFTASALLGNWDPSLLSRYFFGRQFVETNRERFLELGLSQAGCAELLPVFSSQPRSSLQRRADRGRRIYAAP